MSPTRRQRQVLDFIRAAISGNGVAPTLQEIGDSLGVTKVTVLQHLRALERRGFLRRQRYVSRAIDLVGEACPTCGRIS